MDINHLEFEFKRVIDARIAHCDVQLENRKIIDEDEIFVYFDNGEHYSKPVMKALKEALTQSITQWRPLIWQQIVRQLWEEDSRNRTLFYFATEELLVLER